jgi:hypothetical protein
MLHFWAQICAKVMGHPAPVHGDCPVNLHQWKWKAQRIYVILQILARGKIDGFHKLRRGAGLHRVQILGGIGGGNPKILGGQ